MNSNHLPRGWVWTRLGEIITFEYGKGLVEDKRDKNGNIPVYGSNGIVGYHSVPLTEKPCLIVGRKGAAGYVHLSKVPCWSIDTTYYIIPPDELNLVFLYYLLSILNLNSLDKSTAIPGLNRNDAYALRIPLPEQRRIVTKLEELFTRLDAGVSELKKTQAQLKRYRQSVLKTACEGKLVPTEAEIAKVEGQDYESADESLARILKERLSKYKEPTTRIKRDFPANRTCSYGVLQPGDDVEIGVPLVRVGDIKEGRIVLNGMKKIATEIAAEYARTKLEGGEVLITLVGAIGRTAIVPKSLAGANTARAVGVIPLNIIVDASWVNIWFQQAKIIAEMTAKSHEVARKTLNLEDVRSALIALPPR